MQGHGDAQSDTEDLAPVLEIEQVLFPSNYSVSWKSLTAPGPSSWSVYYASSPAGFWMRAEAVCFAQRMAACLGCARIEQVPAPAWYSQNVLVSQH